MKPIKQPASYEKQIKSIKDKGFLVSDPKECRSFLEKVSYYRLKAYYLPFKKKDGSYFSNIDFQRVQNIYFFDQALRTLVFSAIETVEIHLRTQISYYFSMKYGSLGYCDPGNFNPGFNKPDFDSRIQQVIKENKTSLIVKHHETYYAGQYPLFVIIEFFSIGFLSHFYLYMKKPDRKQISRNLYNAPDQTLLSWFRCLTDLRNKCAHYSRLYYWIFTAQPAFHNDTPVFPVDFSAINKKKLFTQLYMLKLMFPDKSKWNTEFVVPLKELIDEYKNDISLKHIGFPDDWEVQLRNS